MRQTGSHRVYVKTGCLRPVIIPTYPEIDPEIIAANLRTANLTRQEYFKYLKEC
jgi:predicted RNA binding protein YcfA (HicA-like mRNA interferase family)